MSDLKKIPKAVERKIANHAQAVNKSVRRKELQKANKKAKRGGKEKRVRDKNWTPANINLANLADPAAWDEFEQWEENGLVGGERIMPVGEQERKRELEKALFRSQNGPEDEEDEPAPDEDDGHLAGTIAGRVIEVSSGLCRVVTEVGILLCTIRQGLRTFDSTFFQAPS